VGKFAESLQAVDRLLGSGKLPASERARIEENRRFGMERIHSAKQSDSRRARNERKRKRRRR